MSSIIYNLREKGLKKPENPRWINYCYLLLKVPILCRMAKYVIYRYLHLPNSVNLLKGFYCSSNLLEVGEHTGLGNLHVIAWAKVTIGNNCSFSFDNKIITSTHDFDDFRKVIATPVTIGDNVWITSNVTILPGVTIGSNTVIGAGSVVTKNIQGGVFAAGNPCRVIRKINFKIEVNDNEKSLQ